ncbi:hypothetical protein F5B18DRAFT_48671 [Nemania serpens]|nr:hypothetical protein F5B18DRAFT_48671 [Nemania serpens]
MKELTLRRPCKNRKIKCGEEHPVCVNCQRTGEACDYSIRLNWDGRRGKQADSSLVGFARDALSPTTPTKGFKLVHQYLSADTPGARRVEPLTGAYDQLRFENRPRTGVGPVDTAPPFLRESEQHATALLFSQFNPRINFSDTEAIREFGHFPTHSRDLLNFQR